MMKKTVKAFWIVLGCVSFALGTVGVVLPILPTFPFYLLTLFCFTKSSERLKDWFVNTKLYKKNLDSFVKNRSMTRKTKIRIMATVTAVMAFGFLMMSRVPVARIILCCVWVGHVLFFVFGVKTAPEEEDSEDAEKMEADAEIGQTAAPMERPTDTESPADAE